jgi:type II secretory pathway pseudopilin PulG
MVRPQSRARAQEGGFTYLALLVGIAIVSLGTSIAAEMATATIARQRMTQANWAGDQYARALRSYQLVSGPMGEFPETLDQLVDDRRGPVPRRHLRSLYRNPLESSGRWHLLRGGDGRIRGVAARAAVGS